MKQLNVSVRDEVMKGIGFWGLEESKSFKQIADEVFTAALKARGYLKEEPKEFGGDEKADEKSWC